MIKTGDKNDTIKVQGPEQGSGCCEPVPVKIQEGTAEQARRLAAMSDPTRLGIIALLAAQSEPLCVCEIQPNFDPGQPTISHHLRVLHDAHLVTWEKRGLWVYYSLDRHTLEQATIYLNGLLSESLA
ncbi:MAG: metalloregulator ArsR/SmtB family transcription factor [Chloroflexota bacterium]|nr:metalloregulator ArsR/SmtB family transcription factor [Chloroflexota bacterium]